MRPFDPDDFAIVERGMSVFRLREASTYFVDEGGRGMYGKQGQLVALGRCFREGLGVRAAAKQTGCCTETTAKFYRALQRRGFAFFCPCGKDLVHRGGCSHRNKTKPAENDSLARRRAIVRRASAKWYANLSEDARSNLIARKWAARKMKVAS